MLSLKALFTTAKSQYLLITGNYWSFTITDGALRMLVVLYFHQLGYSPLAIALLFLFYEFFGVITNLFGGWMGARLGLNRTMNLGLALQIAALCMLLVPAAWLTVPWVMAAQAMSGIAKDLNKMSAKSGVKILLENNQESTLLRRVALLTGSKNALKGVGFFVGGVLLTWVGFQGAVGLMAAVLLIVWLLSIYCLHANLGRSKFKPKFTQMFSQSQSVNALAAARLFLFGARDIWFVVAVPVFLIAECEWSASGVGSFLAIWVIGYGVVQAMVPSLFRQRLPDGRSALMWVCALMALPVAIVLAMGLLGNAELVLVAGLLVFGAVFAVNSSLHSYLIVSYAKEDSISMEVGFYYMANAMGRLVGTVLSGGIYQIYGLEACLWASSIMLLIAALLSLRLPTNSEKAAV